MPIYPIETHLSADNAEPEFDLVSIIKVSANLFTHSASHDKSDKARVPLTFARSFDDLGEDVFGDFAVLHCRLSLLNPFGSSVPQQTTGFPHLSDEGPVPRIELQMQHFNVTFRPLGRKRVVPRARSHHEKSVSDIVHHPLQAELNGSGERGTSPQQV